MNINNLLAVVIHLTYSFCILASSQLQAESEPIYDADWKTLRIVDVNAIEWDERFRMGKKGTSSGKLLYSNDSDAILFYVQFAPGWDAATKDRHYHDFHEWGYVLEGDFLLYEFVIPEQTNGNADRDAARDLVGSTRV